MSAYTTGRPTPVIPLPNVQDIQPSSGPNVFDKLEGLVHATRQLDAALNNERMRTRHLQEQLTQTHAKFESHSRETDSKNNELVAREAKLQAAVSEFQNNEKKLNSKIAALSTEFHKIRSELAQYRAAWSDVLQREREAKLIIYEGEKLHEKVEQLETQNRELSSAITSEKARREQTERHSKSYQLELQNTLVRLHSAEAKFNELTKEFQVTNQARKSVEEQVAAIEKTMRERFQWEVVKERERLRTELQKQGALEREQLRENVRGSEIFQGELQKQLNLAREQLEAAVRPELERKIRVEVTAEADLQLTAERERFAQERERFAKMREEAELQVLNLEGELKRTRQIHGESRRDADEVQQELERKLQEAHAEAARLQDRINRFDNELKGIREGSTLLRDELNRAGSFEREVQELQRVLAEERVRSKETEKRLNDSLTQQQNQQRGEQQAQEQNSRSQIEALEAKLKTAEANLQAAEAKIQAAVAELEKERQRVQEIEESTNRKIDAVVNQVKLDQLQAGKARASQDGVMSWFRSGRPSAQKDKNYEWAYESELARAKILEAALVSEKERFELVVSSLEAEVAQLKSIYPLKDLMAIKEREIRKAEQALLRIPPRRPAHERVEKMLKVLQEDRKGLQALIDEHEARLAEQLQRIAVAKSESTLLAEADEVEAADTYAAEIHVEDALDMADDVHPVEC